MIRKFGIICIFLFLFVCVGIGKEYTYEKGPVSVVVGVEEEKITLADVINLSFDVNYPQEYELSLPEIEEPNSFDVIDVEESRLLGADERIKFNLKYKLEPLSVGEIEIPGLEFLFTSEDVNDGGSIKIVTNAIQIAVEATIDVTDPNVIAEAEELEPVAVPRFEAKWWMFTPIAFVILLIAATGYFQKRKSKSGQEVEILRAAHEIAFDEIRSLMARGLIEDGKIKEFYEELSNILRKYIEARFYINAPDLTTEEFLGEISTSRKLEDEDKNSLGDFLSQCDLVKFAKHEPERADIDKSVELAIGFIDKTKQVAVESGGGER